MKQILSLNNTELVKIVTEMGEKKYRAEQLSSFLANYKDFYEMTNLSKQFREKLASEYIVKVANIERVFESKDGTKKFVLKLIDGEIIEAVILSYKYGNTLCISTQVGCAMGCAFCVSGKNGLFRNLTTAEMVAEVLCINAYLGGTKEDRKITNIVLMGSGEPLANYDNVVKFLRIISSKESLNISIRNITLSTCGIVPRIYDLAKEDLGLSLTLSLHASQDCFRKKIMKIAKSYTIAELFNAVRDYQQKTNRRVCFEYIMFEENTTLEDVKRLKELSRGITCFFNLIPLNYGNSEGLHPADKKRRDEFLKMMLDNGMTATIRRTLGEDINGACGQLVGKLREEKSKLQSKNSATDEIVNNTPSDLIENKIGNNIKVSASILALDYRNKELLKNKLIEAKNAGCDFIHLDICDGTFVKEKSFDSSMLLYVKNIVDLPLDVHLMINNPKQKINEYLLNKPHILIIQFEIGDEDYIISTLKEIKSKNVNSGIAIEPHTKLQDLYKLLDKNKVEKFLDYVLVLSVEPGRSGQAFISGADKRIMLIKEKYPEIKIISDGGVNTKNAKKLAKAGASILVSGSAIFSSEDMAKTIKELKN